MEVAARAYHLDSVMFLHDKRSEDEDAIDFDFRAAVGDHLDVIQFVYGHYLPIDNAVVLRVAALNGS